MEPMHQTFAIAGPHDQRSTPAFAERTTHSNSPTKRQLDQMLQTAEQNTKDDSFALKLTEISSGMPVSSSAVPATVEPVRTSPTKQRKVMRVDLQNAIDSFEHLLLQQKSRNPANAELNQVLDMLALNFAAVQMSAGRLMDTMASSPVKQSPKKRRSPTKENQNPSGDATIVSFTSPTKKASTKDMSEERRQRRHAADADLDGKYLSENVPAPTEGSPNKSGLKTLPKSPVKRMRQLERQAEQQEAQVDVETAYKTSPQKVVDPEEAQTDQDEARALGKTLLAEINGCQEKIQTVVQAKATPEVDINTVLDVDSNVINYGQFICGKILGSTLLLSNLSGKDQPVQLAISRSPHYNCDDIFGPYNRDELPFSYKDSTLIKNSELEHNCWYIENPTNKELQKTLVVTLPPQSNQEFIVVVKAPKNRLQSRIVSFIDVTLADQIVPAGDGAVEKHVSHRRAEPVLKKSSQMEILLLGFLDNPRIKCVKQLVNKASGQEIISLAVRKIGSVQKFKLPFKNLSNYLDSEIEFAFIRTSQTERDAAQLQPIDCVQFHCQPNQLKITADSMQILTVQCKVNMDLLNDKMRVDQQALKAPLSKLLVARLKNSQVLFSYFISITLVESDAAPA